MRKLDNNDRQVVLSWHIDTKIPGLRNICGEGRFINKNYFKPTYRKGYIAIYSCHHINWLFNIHKRGSLLDCIGIAHLWKIMSSRLGL